MKKHGHCCKICGEYKANEKFSGKGHAAHKRFVKSRSRWIYPSFQNTYFVFCGDWGAAPVRTPRISPSTHTTSEQGVLARFSEKCFVRGEKKPDFFNPFPKKIQGIHTKTLNCGGGLW